MNKHMRELNELNDKELLQRLTELQKERMRLNAQRYIGNLKDTAKPREVRKEIARVNTILRLRQDRKI
jgi:large subunit ribosomal protein L29